MVVFEFFRLVAGVLDTVVTTPLHIVHKHLPTCQGVKFESGGDASTSTSVPECKGRKDPKDPKRRKAGIKGWITRREKQQAARLQAARLALKTKQRAERQQAVIQPVTKTLDEHAERQQAVIQPVTKALDVESGEPDKMEVNVAFGHHTHSRQVPSGTTLCDFLNEYKETLGWGDVQALRCKIVGETMMFDVMIYSKTMQDLWVINKRMLDGRKFVKIIIEPVENHERASMLLDMRVEVGPKVLQVTLH